MVNEFGPLIKVHFGDLVSALRPRPKNNESKFRENFHSFYACSTIGFLSRFCEFFAKNAKTIFLQVAWQKMEEEKEKGALTKSLSVMFERERERAEC